MARFALLRKGVSMAAKYRSRCPIQCIIPPYMTDHMVEHGDAETRRRGIELLTESARIRGQREVRALMAPMMARSRAFGIEQRTIYDAKNVGLGNQTVVRREGQPAVNDPAVNEAYDGLGATYDYFKTHLGRNSIDGNGMKLDATVHYMQKYNNAFWDGEQMVFGDGDGQLFTRFTAALDIIAHELTHGVIDNTARLQYEGETGALNESIADVLGILVKHHSLGISVSTADWVIGQGILGPAVNGVGLRSMIEPGTAYNDPILGPDPQPGHMRDYVVTSNDHGGVHINSGIANRAFVVAATEIGGDAWNHAGLIWYRTLLRLHDTATFADAATISAQFAAETFGSGSNQHRAVQEGWRVVGVQTSSQVRPRDLSMAAATVEPDFDAMIERVAERLGTKLVEVVATAMQRERTREVAAISAPTTKRVSKKKSATTTKARKTAATKKNAVKKRASKKNS